MIPGETTNKATYGAKEAFSVEHVDFDTPPTGSLEKPDLLCEAPQSLSSSAVGAPSIANNGYSPSYLLHKPSVAVTEPAPLSYLRARPGNFDFPSPDEAGAYETSMESMAHCGDAPTTDSVSKGPGLLHMTKAPLRVLKHIDLILSEKINMEVELFHSSLHSLLSQQYSNHQQLLSLLQQERCQQVVGFPGINISDALADGKESRQGEPMAPESSTRFGRERKPEGPRKADGEDLNKYMIQLLTSASVLTSALHEVELDDI